MTNRPSMWKDGDRPRLPAETGCAGCKDGHELNSLADWHEVQRVCGGSELVSDDYVSWLLSERTPIWVAFVRGGLRVVTNAGRINQPSREQIVMLRNGGYQMRRISAPFRCMRCHEPIPYNGIMYQRRSEMVCTTCAVEVVKSEAQDVHLCVACGSELTEDEREQQHCGDGRSKCARRLRRMAESEATKQDEMQGASAL